MLEKALNIVPGKLYRVTPKKSLGRRFTEKLYFVHADEHTSVDEYTSVDSQIVVMALELTTDSQYIYLKCLFQEKISLLILGVRNPSGPFSAMYGSLSLLKEECADQKD